jgi:CMP-N,N'-diacetyllegionaminic acid synthase
VNILAVIPARGGSKGVREKNLVRIGDYTLVERALFTALGCEFIKKIIVSSDSKKIINLANKYGDYAPFVRPAHLATDQAGSHGVIKHALEWSESKDSKEYDYIVLLEPPAPFRLPKHIEDALEITTSVKATSVMSVVEVLDHHPIRMKKMDASGSLRGYAAEEPEGLRRQDQEKVYIRNCAVNVFSRSTIKSGRLWGDSPYGYLMNRDLYAINIDEQLDILTANEFYKVIMGKNQTNLIEFIPSNIIF